MQTFFGAANFFHTHISNYAEWASSLYECTTTIFNWTPPTWGKDYKTIFEIFKLSIQTAVTLHFPDYNLRWVIHSDASDHALGVFCSKSTVILMGGRYINQLPLLLTSFQVRLLIGTRSNKKPVLYTMQ